MIIQAWIERRFVWSSRQPAGAMARLRSGVMR
jgi:hypothetical protein